LHIAISKHIRENVEVLLNHPRCVDRHQEQQQREHYEYLMRQMQILKFSLQENGFNLSCRMGTPVIVELFLLRSPNMQVEFNKFMIHSSDETQM
jgi:hypothetical protein